MPQPPSSAHRAPDPSRTPRAERPWRTLLGQRLRALRLHRGETLAVVAERANVSLQYLSEVERGVKEASSEVVAAIAAALEVTLLDLVEGVAEELRDDRAPLRRRDFRLAA